MSEAKFRLRVTYQKVGPVRFLSHLETARACERSIRRAGLPYAVTHGFNPHMRIAFGPALPVGTAGRAEMYDVWLTELVGPDDALERLRHATREELRAIACRYVDPKGPSLAAAADVAHYEVAVSGPPEVAESIARGLSSVSRSGTLTVEHKGKQKVFELATTLLKEPVVRPVDEGAVVEVVTRMSEQGSLRPDALVKAALGPALAGVASVSVTRTRLASRAADGTEEAL
ncbi:TIGR03936 family radical SAM-associated protein [Coriobacteriia bacterium Es71-Z0120]|uniref:TIGR03936 family radical SAM-associated protein n=1 Tax=Parvivirga hydrogeniphila TaxID=2939460 RepID=UPI002260DC15|nr:TIGR03936 family radical SAM-associated protein [Parvivirga hydrogeniphila]MCL4078968.1 TIGR03936 family radical SAM-associated protein [Parvivirga hydrogeniphila]